MGFIWDFYRIVIHNLITIYTFVVIVGIVLSWLVSFNVVNTRNQFVAMVWQITGQLTEPALRRIRRVIPPMGGLDFSAVVLILGLMFLDQALYRALRPFAGM